MRRIHLDLYYWAQLVSGISMLSSSEISAGGPSKVSCCETFHLCPTSMYVRKLG